MSIIRGILISLGSLLLPTCCYATVAGFGGSTEVTQIANNVQLGLSYIEQVQMLQAQWDDVVGHANLTWSDAAKAAGILKKIGDVAKRGAAMSYALENAEAIYRAKNPGYKVPSGTVGYRERFQDWSRTNLDSISGALLTAGLQYKDFESEAKILEKLRKMTNSSDSTVKVVQTVSMFSAQLVEQLQKLRQLQMAQIQMQAGSLSTDQSKKDEGRRLTEQYFTPYQPRDTNRFSSAGGTK